MFKKIIGNPVTTPYNPNNFATKQELKNAIDNIKFPAVTDRAIGDKFGNVINDSYISDVLRLTETELEFFTPSVAGKCRVSAPSQKYVDDAINNAIANLEIPDGSGGSSVDIVIDDALSDTSENPVQNKVVNAAIQHLEENKADALHTHDFGAKIEGTKYIEEIKWGLGAITSDNGTNGANVARARTVDYLEYDESVVLTTSGYAQIIAFFYNDEKGYIGYSGRDWLTGTRVCIRIK